MAYTEKAAEAWTISVGLLFWIVVPLLLFLVFRDSPVRLFASVQRDNVDTHLRAVVEVFGKKDGPLAGAIVWGVDNHGNVHRPESISEDSLQHSFLIPTHIWYDVTQKVGQVTFYADPPAKKRGRYRRGDTMVEVSPSRARYKTLNPIFFLIPVSLFVITILLAALPVFGSRIVYSICLVFAVLLSITMTSCIAWGIGYVSQNGETFDVLRLAFGYVFKDTYVAGQQEEWLFSFTSPPRLPTAALDEPTADSLAAAGLFEAVPTASEPVKGFGAPLWVILLSVIGASMFTIKIIVSVVKERTSGARLYDDEVFTRNIHAILLHQFYILFAPIASILVYQTLVAADAADQHVAVALAVIGAGVATNELLDRARKKAAESPDRLAESLDQLARAVERAEPHGGAEAVEPKHEAAAAVEPKPESAEAIVEAEPIGASANGEGRPAAVTEETTEEVGEVNGSELPMKVEPTLASSLHRMLRSTLSAFGTWKQDRSDQAFPAANQKEAAVETPSTSPAGVEGDGESKTASDRRPGTGPV